MYPGSSVPVPKATGLAEGEPAVVQSQRPQLLELDPFVLTDRAVCIRDSEGSFDDRRARLDQSLQHSMTVTKMDLIQRNIVQGVNVVRRGMRMLEPLIERRPSLSYMIGANKLPTDYIDQAFPSDPAHAVAPRAERIASLSLHRLLPAGGPVNFLSPAKAQGAPNNLDPAMLAAMVVQAAMATNQRQQMASAQSSMPAAGLLHSTMPAAGLGQGSLPAAGLVQGSMPAGHMPQAQLDAARQAMTGTAPIARLQQAQMAAAAFAAASAASVSSTRPASSSTSSTPGSSGRPPQVAQTDAVPAAPSRAAPVASTAGSTAGSETGNSATGQAFPASPPARNPLSSTPSPSAARLPKPSLQAQRRTPLASRRVVKPPFVQLIESFCERSLAQEAAGASAAGLQGGADRHAGARVGKALAMHDSQTPTDHRYSDT